MANSRRAGDVGRERGFGRIVVAEPWAPIRRVGCCRAGGLVRPLRPRPRRHRLPEARGRRGRRRSGRFGLVSVLYRPDRLRRPRTALPVGADPAGRRLVRRSRRPALQPPGRVCPIRRATSGCGARTTSTTWSSSSTTTSSGPAAAPAAPSSSTSPPPVSPRPPAASRWHPRRCGGSWPRRDRRRCSMLDR